MDDLTTHDNNPSTRGENTGSQLLDGREGQARCRQKKKKEKKAPVSRFVDKGLDEVHQHQAPNIDANTAFLS